MKSSIFFVSVVFVLTGFASVYRTSSCVLSVCKATIPSEHTSSEQKNRAQEIIARLQSNFDELDKVSYQIQWESLNNDGGKSSFLADVKFKRPFYYFEKGTGNRIYTYVSDGTFEQYIYGAQADGFVGKSRTPPIGKVNEASGFLERFPLRILQTENMEFVEEKVVDDPNKIHVTCDVIRNDYWQVYVAKDSNLVILADYYRERGNTKDVISRLCNFKYSEVKIGEKKVIYFPVSFMAIIPSTKYAWKCSVSGLQINSQTSFDDSIFKFKK